MEVKFFDLKKQYLQHKADIDQSIEESFNEFTFLKGKKVDEFEAAFKTSLGIKHVISVANGTDALLIALMALGVTTNDEVITPSFSWISSSETISHCGAKPVFTDVDEQTYTINPLLLEEKITSKTKAILVVHLYGQSARMTEIQKICKQYNLALIEDCAQAHLTEENGKFAGTFGEASCFSFYPTKNLGAYGDAGCVITENDNLAEKIRRYANHGALEKDDHLFEGVNSRMDTLQAAVLLAKLPYLNTWNLKRVQNAGLYTSLLLQEKNIMTPFIRPETVHTFHIYAIRAKQRDVLKKYLADHGVQTMIHYPKALPFLPAYKHLKANAKDFPVSFKLQNELISLPIYPELDDDEINYACEKIKAFYRK